MGESSVHFVSALFERIAEVDEVDIATGPAVEIEPLEVSLRIVRPTPGSSGRHASVSGDDAQRDSNPPQALGSSLGGCEHVDATVLLDPDAVRQIFVPFIVYMRGRRLTHIQVVVYQ